MSRSFQLRQPEFVARLSSVGTAVTGIRGAQPTTSKTTAREKIEDLCMSPRYTARCQLMQQMPEHCARFCSILQPNLVTLTLKQLQHRLARPRKQILRH